MDLFSVHGARYGVGQSGYRGILASPEHQWNREKFWIGIENSCEQGRACVRVAETVSSWFKVNKGLQQGCWTSARSFDDGVVREAYERSRDEVLR